MKKYRVRQVLSLFSIGIAVLLSFVFIGQGCGDFSSSKSTGSNINGPFTDNGLTCSSGKSVVDKNYVVQPNRRTVSILYGQQLLDAFVSCTGIGQPSARTSLEFSNRQQSFSEYGLLIDVSAAMLMAVTATGAEVCKDAIDRERVLGVGDNRRVLFRNVNLASNGLTSTEVTSTVNALSYSCWQKIPTLAERSELQTLVTDLNRMSVNSERGALALCTAMLGSLAAIEQ